jgi:hypothetical protein
MVKFKTPGFCPMLVRRSHQEKFDCKNIVYAAISYLLFLLKSILIFFSLGLLLYKLFAVSTYLIGFIRLNIIGIVNKKI